MDAKFTPVIINIYNGTGSISAVDLSSFGKDRVTFGSGLGNDIHIDSVVVSENHGYFQFTNMGWIVLDNNSKNGIVIGGLKRKDAKLTNGMEISISDIADKSKPAATMFVEINSGTVAHSVDKNATATEEPVAKPKKKSKAPLIIGIILAVLLVLGILGAIVLGVGGVALYNYIKPNKIDTSVTVDVTDEYVDDTVDGGDIIIDMPEETEPEKIPVELPERVPTDPYCEQYILAECDDSYATITFYELEDGVWVEKMSTSGRVGKNGITENKREGDGCTPAGEFDLTFCCGVSAPDSAMTFRKIDENSVWVDDVNSYYYNTLQSSAYYAKDWDSAEPMLSSYFSDNRHNYCINIAANGDGYTSDSAYPGCGSVITLCGKNDTLAATQGCVDISGSAMLDLLSHLDSSKSPVIIIYE